jgi:hypothetical protein
VDVRLLHLKKISQISYRQAGESVRRNDPGDREKAFKALSGAFEEVYEIPYISTPIKKEKEGFDECR